MEYVHTCSRVFFEGGVTFVNPIFDKQFFSKIIKKKNSKKIQKKNSFFFEKTKKIVYVKYNLYFVTPVPYNDKNKTEKSFSNIAASQFCFSRSNKSTTTLQF
jgi:hypothetical protein